MDKQSYFYVYAYLRSQASMHGPKGSPYYIGKGKGMRAFTRGKKSVPRPRDKACIVFIQEGLTEQEAFSLEKYCIALYGRINTNTGILRNLTDGGEGASGAKLSIETRAKIAARQRGNQIWLGKRHSQETIDKLAHINRGKKLSLETKAKISLALQGEKNPFFGKRHTPEVTVKMTQCLYELTDPDGEIYATTNIKEFARQHGLDQGTLSKIIHGTRKAHKGWTAKIIERYK
jgi:hypothetical protein